MSCGGGLEEARVEWDPRAAVGVVMASAGYPGRYDKGRVINGLDDVADPAVKVFHAGTRSLHGRVLTDGGRVLCTVGLGNGVADARERAYRAVGTIHWDGAFFRRDIGHRALSRER
jgi:phosphoribosylamine---glycine ligase